MGSKPGLVTSGHSLKDCCKADRPSQARVTPPELMLSFTQRWLTKVIIPRMPDNSLRYALFDVDGHCTVCFPV
jgi:hypothetical protein